MKVVAPPKCLVLSKVGQYIMWKAEFIVLKFVTGTGRLRRTIQTTHITLTSIMAILTTTM